MYEILGYIAILAGTAGYYYTEPRKVMKIGLLAQILWILYFSLLNLGMAVVISILGLIRQIAAIYMPDKQMHYISISVLCALVCLILVYDFSWVSLLPILAASFKTGSAWLRDYPIGFRCSNIRCSNICAEIPYLTLAIISGAQALGVSALIVIAVNFITSLFIMRRHSFFYKIKI